MDCRIPKLMERMKVEPPAVPVLNIERGEQARNHQCFRNDESTGRSKSSSLPLEVHSLAMGSDENATTDTVGREEKEAGPDPLSEEDDLFSSEERDQGDADCSIEKEIEDALMQRKDVMKIVDKNRASSTSREQVSRNRAGTISPAQQTCTVCTETFTSPNLPLTLSCEHQQDICNGCLSKYVTVEIEKSTFEIRCPRQNCEGVLSHEQIRGLVDDEIFGQYDTMLLNRALETNEEFRWCAAPNCGNGLFNVLNFTNFITCEKCNTKTCIKHRTVWHEGMTCEEFDALEQKKERECEEEEKSAAVLKLMKKCPKCNVPVQKNGGCDHMTCWCGFQFCWLCLVPYSNIRKFGNSSHKADCSHYRP